MGHVTQILGIEYPVFQGAMAQVALPELASAVSNAGGLGILASGGWSADHLRTQIRRCRAMTDKPFAVNLMLMMPNTADLVDVLIEEGVKIVTTGAGTPKSYMPALKSAGVIVIPVIPSVRLARKMEEIGADAVVAEGTEAGGHVGEITTMALLPQVVDAVSIPVIAAGGVADARGIVAAFALGAQGVQMGTRFVATVESPAHESCKRALLAAADTATVLTGRRKGAPVRTIRNQMTEEYLRLENDPEVSLEELEKLTLGSLRRGMIEGDTENGSIMVGQISGLIHDIPTCRDVITSLMRDARTLSKNLEIC